ncbi:MAG: GIY-YIG nuclease family protein [Euryarchaeota archaeon]|nr:GIY-YIG nuclease family protein [Euryarchaeota archaeon]
MHHKGTYCLIIQMVQDSKIEIGKLGEIDFQKGYYVYVGSALNSLEGRIRRHLSDEKKLFWHIDSLLVSEYTKIVDVVFSESSKKWECKIANQISKTGNAVNGFGCSDCRCLSHLFHFKSLQDSKKSCLDSFEKFKLDSGDLYGLKISL